MRLLLPNMPVRTGLDELLTASEVACILGVRPKRVYEMN